MRTKGLCLWCLHSHEKPPFSAEDWLYWWLLSCLIKSSYWHLRFCWMSHSCMKQSMCALWSRKANIQQEVCFFAHMAGAAARFLFEFIFFVYAQANATVSRPHYTRHNAKAIRQSYAYHQLRSCSLISNYTPNNRELRRESVFGICREEDEGDYKWKRAWECSSTANTGWTSSDVRDWERKKKRNGERLQMCLRKVNRTDWLSGVGV